MSQYLSRLSQQTGLLSEPFGNSPSSDSSYRPLSDPFRSPLGTPTQGALEAIETTVATPSDTPTFNSSAQTVQSTHLSHTSKRAEKTSLSQASEETAQFNVPSLRVESTTSSQSACESATHHESTAYKEAADREQTSSDIPTAPNVGARANKRASSTQAEAQPSAFSSQTPSSANPQMGTNLSESSSAKQNLDPTSETASMPPSYLQTLEAARKWVAQQSTASLAISRDRAEETTTAAQTIEPTLEPTSTALDADSLAELAESLSTELKQNPPTLPISNSFPIFSESSDSPRLDLTRQATTPVVSIGSIQVTVEAPAAQPASPPVYTSTAAFSSPAPRLHRHYIRPR